jgi:peptidyl-prolyl cis-trans isomerase B (cyclophilin B)
VEAAEDPHMILIAPKFHRGVADECKRRGIIGFEIGNGWMETADFAMGQHKDEIVGMAKPREEPAGDDPAKAKPKRGRKGVRRLKGGEAALMRKRILGDEADEGGAGEQAAPAENGIGIHHAVISVKDYGDIQVELDGDTAPVTVQNFMDLAEAGFYDGLTFHRIMDGFMIQGGDPNGDGSGGSEKTIQGEFASNGVANGISHEKGAISMARAQDPNSASSQFFITVGDADFLDGDYAAFGHVTEGQEVADAIAADAKPLDDNGTIAPEDQPVITKVTVID